MVASVVPLFSCYFLFYVYPWFFVSSFTSLGMLYGTITL